MDRRQRIAALNDQLRTTFKGGRVQMTPSVYELDDRLRGRALSALARSLSETHGVLAQRDLSRAPDPFQQSLDLM
jgi:hypothetical protein